MGASIADLLAGPVHFAVMMDPTLPATSARPVLWPRQSGPFRRDGVSVELDHQHSGTAIAGGGYHTIASGLT